MAKTVVVGMSGGVDSSVAALLLKQQGYNVIGLFMHNWEEDDDSGHCTAEEDYKDVRMVCSKIGIPYYSVNYSKEYKERVFKDFLEEYAKGRTPNPDVLCNKEIKFGPFLEFANSIGADYIATGHYCKVSHENGVHKLLKAVDTNKDQTYFLNQLNQHQLEKILFPLGDMVKPDVRKIAEQYDLITYNKKDSTGICFIGERNFRNFLKNYLPAKPGEIKNIANGKVIGKHDGLMYYTLGQRKGLGIGGRRDGNGQSWFVIKKDLDNNVLWVSQGEGDELFTDGLITYKVNWIPTEPKENEFDCFAKFRYRQPDQKVHVTKLENGNIKVDFYQKQRAVTPGQYVVFYNDTECLGGGVIEETFKK